MVFRIDKWRVHHAVPGPLRTSVQIERLAERELSEILSKNRSSEMMRRLALSFYLPVSAAVVVVVVVVAVVVVVVVVALIVVSLLFSVMVEKQVYRNFLVLVDFPHRYSLKMKYTNHGEGRCVRLCPFFND